MPVISGRLLSLVYVLQECCLLVPLFLVLLNSPLALSVNFTIVSNMSRAVTALKQRRGSCFLLTGKGNSSENCVDGGGNYGRLGPDG